MNDCVYANRFYQVDCTQDGRATKLNMWEDNLFFKRCLFS